MIEWLDRKVLVMGLGSFGGGVGVCRFLAEHGAIVTVTDQAPAQRLTDSIAQLADLHITYHLGEHKEVDFLQSDLIVVNPAVRKDSPWLKLARDNNIPLTAEINLFFEYCPAPIIAVTGSNGKSTTTSMIAAVLQAGTQGQSGIEYGQLWLGGNIGQQNLLSRIDEITADDLVVLELSSFQLHDLAELKRSPHVAVVTNIAPNHLDWHGTMEAYLEDKRNIIRFQTTNDYAILNRLDETVSKWGQNLPSRVIWYPPSPEQTFRLSVPGRHNQINAAAAWSVGRLFGVPEDQIKEALKNYQSLPHRLELVDTVNDVKYYNDSIATTPESVIAALEAFKQPKLLILGGFDKKISFTELAQKIAAHDKVRALILLGQVRDKLAEELTKSRNQAPCHKVDTLEQAVHTAAQNAQPGDVVLLSPRLRQLRHVQELPATRPNLPRTG